MTVAFEMVAAELARARAKFPGNDHLLAALTEEVGELAQAYLNGNPGAARLEAIQVACVAIRIIEEGDAEFEGADYVSTESDGVRREAIDTIAGFDPDEMSWADIGREARAVAIAARDQYEEEM